MRVYVAKRLLQTLAVLLGVSLLVFLLLRAAPGDAAHMRLADLGVDPSPEALNAARESLGLNAPLWRQYFVWLGGVLRGDLGASVFTARPVAAEIAAHFGPTALLALPALALAAMAAFPLGCVSAMYQGRLADKLARGFSIAVSSAPAFCLGLLLILLFGVRLNWLPTFGAGGAAYMVMPCVTLAAGLAAYYTRFVRAALLEQLSRGYIRAARARGVPPLRALLADALKNAAVPLITSLGVSAAMLLSGSAVVEKVFSWPGLGKYFVDAVLRRDYPAVQGCVLLFGAVFALLNLVCDLACALADPRVRRAAAAREAAA